MSKVSHRASSLLMLAVVSAGCSEVRQTLDGSLGVVEVLETPAPIALEPTPLDALLIQPFTQLHFEPLPMPPQHVVRASRMPTGARRLDEVQSVEVEIEVEGGALGTRQISAVFVSPLGLVWERQGTLIEARRGEKQLAVFSLPVASTFITDQHLSGTWQVVTLDEGAELTNTTFALEE